MNQIKKIFSIVRLGVAAVVMTAVAGCGQPQNNSDSAKKTEPESPFILTTSIHDIMLSIVDPAADAIWNSVVITATRDGVERTEPQTEEEWQALRNSALTLMEAGNLLAMQGRPLVAEGKQLEDEGLYGNLTSKEIQQLIDDNWDQFVYFSQSLHLITAQVLKAIDNQDTDALLELSGQIDVVCENCHVTFWYPGQELPY